MYLISLKVSEDNIGVREQNFTQIGDMKISLRNADLKKKVPNKNKITYYTIRIQNRTAHGGFIRETGATTVCYCRFFWCQGR